VGVLVARAERAGRAAIVSEQQALAAVMELEQGPDPHENAVLSVVDHAILAEERMRRLLSLLKRSPPDAAAADLEDLAAIVGIGIKGSVPGHS
jgi:hypothetical protein